MASIFGDVTIVKEEKGSKSPLERATDEINRYKELPQINVAKNPLKWWKDNSIYFPLLSNLVKSRLCIPATSVPSERIFSTAGDIVTAQRATLSSDMVDKLIFLKKTVSNHLCVKHYENRPMDVIQCCKNDKFSQSSSIFFLIFPQNMD